MKTAPDHYDRLYGDLGLHPQDAAKWVFASGWNCAIEEMIERINAMPLGQDTRALLPVQTMKKGPPRIGGPFHSSMSGVYPLTSLRSYPFS